MAQFIQIVLAVFFLANFRTALSTETNTKQVHPKDEEELIQSESKDGKLEIIKRIKKVNNDGSYTIGYEADDGSFKIESRDVLGNIKGTYGFVDDEGEVKRVSYSSSNATDIFTKRDPEVSAVQRIPKIDKGATTEKPSTYSTYFPTTQSTPTTTTSTVIQSIARKKASSTTQKPNYSTVESIRSTSKSNSIIYTSAAPRVLLQRPSIASTVASNAHTQTTKSEGQIIRPELITEKSIYNNLQQVFNAEKAVTEEASEIRSNVLRRQLPPESVEPFNAKEHVYSLQQSLGNDVSDVYNNGATVTSRPLFTTTRSGRFFPILSSTTATPVAVARPTGMYAANYQRNVLQEVDANTAEYSNQEEASTSTEASATSTNDPVVQIPPNRAETPEPLVAIRHPFQKGAILVPLSQLQGKIFPVDSMQDVHEAKRHYIVQQHTTSAPEVEVERQNVKRLNPIALRPLPVQVDENGLIREMPQYAPTPYPLPVPISPVQVQIRPASVIPISKYNNNDMENGIDNIQPPVSTREFQMLLNHLIVRQKRLEKINAITNPKLHQEFYQLQPTRYQRVGQPAPGSYFVQRVVPARQSNQIQYEPQPQESEQPQQRTLLRQVVAVEPREVLVRPRNHYQQQQNSREEVEPENIYPKRVSSSYERHRQQSYASNRRAATFISPRYLREQQSEEQVEEYLPPDVRETLLLRMLQLAMNPALPLDDDGTETQSVATVTTPQYKKAPVRNVEILGEEEEEEGPKRRYGRTKRYKEEDMEYLE